MSAMTVWILIEAHPDWYATEQYALLGVFSSRLLAEQARAKRASSDRCHIWPWEMDSPFFLSAGASFRYMAYIPLQRNKHFKEITIADDEVMVDPEDYEGGPRPRKPGEGVFVYVPELIGPVLRMPVLAQSPQHARLLVIAKLDWMVEKQVVSNCSEDGENFRFQIVGSQDSPSGYGLRIVE